MITKQKISYQPTLDLINSFSKESSLDEFFENIPLEDPNVFNYLIEAPINNTFQFNTQFATSAIKKLKPKNIDDLALLTSIARPGPMKYLDEICDIRDGKKEVHYPCKGAQDIFKNTAGFPVFQESLMRFFVECCGMRYSQADTFRRAMAKKKKDLMASLEDTFKEGFQRVSKVSKKEADDYWQSLLAFCSYGFNKAHAYAYSIMAYKTAWLEYYYPAEYLASSMDSKKNDKDEVSRLCKIAKDRGIKILPPSIKHSDISFTATKDGNIYYGLEAIKGVGSSAEKIINFRENNKNFTFEDLLLGLDKKAFNSRVIKGLIKAGAFDDLIDRKLAFYNVENILAYRDENEKWIKKKEKFESKLTLFSLDEFDLPKPKLELITPDKTNVLDLLDAEKEVLGEYVSKHPIDYVKNKNDFNNIELVISNNKEKYLIKEIYCIVNEIKEVVIKKPGNNFGKKMAFVKFDCKDFLIDVAIFPKHYDENLRKALKENHIFMLSLFIENYDKGILDKSKYKYSLNTIFKIT